MITQRVRQGGRSFPRCQMDLDGLGNRGAGFDWPGQPDTIRISLSVLPLDDDQPLGLALEISL